MVFGKNMKRNGLLALLISGSILTGCQQIDSISNSTANTFNKGKNAFGDWVEKSSFNEFQQMTNTSIRDKFLFYVNDERDRKVVYLAKPLVASGFNIEKRTTGTIHLVKLVNHEGTFAEANRRINNGIYNSEKDLPAKYFVDQARAQGHEVRVYKSFLSSQVNGGLVQVIKDFDGANNRYDVDPVYVEFNKENRPVAIMTRSWQTLAGIGVDSRIYTNIYFAQDGLRWFENRFTNSTLDNALLRVYR